MSLKYVQQHKVCKFVFFLKVLEPGLACDLGLRFMAFLFYFIFYFSLKFIGQFS